MGHRARAAKLTAAGVAVSELPEIAALARGMNASILALQGEAAKAQVLATEALDLVKPAEHVVVGLRARWALGAAAASSGDHDTAFRHLRLMFTAQGAPVHHHASIPATADLVAAAVKTGRQPDARLVLSAVRETRPDHDSPRIEAVLHHAEALLLGDDDAAEPHFSAGLADPAGEHRPFERGRAAQDYGEWLRRRRRMVEARVVLRLAFEQFARIGAEPWKEMIKRELRAAGAPTTAASSGSLSGLTPQQQQIVRLAAQGLSNRKIGEQLFLSARTVSSHLYRAFPKLGVTSRAQLRTRGT